MKKIILNICISCSIAFLIIIGMHFFYRKLELHIPSAITIQASESENSASLGSEVWITNIFVDGHALDLSQIPLEEDQYFRYDAIMLDGKSLHPSLELVFPAAPKANIIIYFTKHDYSGNAVIKYSDTVDTASLYAPEHDTLVYAVKPYLTASDFLNRQEYIAAFALYFFLLLFLTCSSKNRFSSASIFILSFLLINLLFIMVSADFGKWSYIFLQLFLATVFSGFVKYVFIPLYHKIHKNIQHKYYLAIIVIFSICTAYILISYSDLNYQLLRNNNQIDNYPVLLTLHSETAENTSAGELWINSAVIDKKNIPLEELLPYSDNWELKEDNRLFSNISPNYITFPPSSTLPLSVNFVFHPYSGELAIDLNSHRNTLQMYDQNTTWDYINFKYMFFDDILTDINTLIPVSDCTLILYHIISSLMTGLIISCIPLGLFLTFEHYHRIPQIMILILCILSVYEFYRIISGTLISDYTVKLYNYASSDSESSRPVKIKGLSSSGAFNDIGYELDHIQAGEWNIDFRNSISFISPDINTSSPLIYHFERQNLIPSAYAPYDIMKNMVVCVEKSPQGGILAIEFEGKKQIVNCYSPFLYDEYIILDELYSIPRTDPSSGIIFVLLSLLWFWGIKVKDQYLFFIRSESKFSKCFRAIISILFSFMLCGQDIFLKEQVFTIYKYIIYLCIFSFISAVSYLSLPVIILLLNKIYNNIYSTNTSTEKDCTTKKYKLFFIILSIQMFWYLVFLPGGINLDIIAQWEQTQEVTFYNNWHPVFHTMLIKLFTLPDNTIYLYFCFQIVFISLVLTLTADFFIENGIKEHVIFSAFILLLLLPNNEIITEATKDVIGTYSYIWILLLIAKLLLKGPELFWSHKSNILQAFTALLFSMNIRHSQQSVGIIFLLIIFIQMFSKKIRVKTVSSFLISFLLINSMTVNLIYHYTDYYNYTKGLKYVTPIADLASLAVDDLKIDKNTMELIESAMTLDEWKIYYNPYYPSTALFDNNIDFANIFAELSLKDVLSLYMKNFMNYPWHMIRTRLLGSRIIWGITQGTNNLEKNRHTYLEVRPNPFGLERHNTLLKSMGNNYVTSYHSCNLIDVLIWRSGIHIVFLLICLYIICRYSQKIYCIILSPCIVFTALLFIALPAPNYRYIYYLPLTSFFMFLLLPLLINKGK